MMLLLIPFVLEMMTSWLMILQLLEVSFSFRLHSIKFHEIKLYYIKPYYIFSSTVPTSIVNATAPEPSVILRIVDENGDDISGTRLGQALYIRIEIVGDTIFDIFARNLVAKSGLDEEEIVLLDDRGCPADPVFPGMIIEFHEKKK